jgi:hypothetical protein
MIRLVLRLGDQRRRKAVRCIALSCATFVKIVHLRVDGEGHIVAQLSKVSLALAPARVLHEGTGDLRAHALRVLDTGPLQTVVKCTIRVRENAAICRSCGGEAGWRRRAKNYLIKRTGQTPACARESIS